MWRFIVFFFNLFIFGAVVLLRIELKPLSTLDKQSASELDPYHCLNSVLGNSSHQGAQADLRFTMQPKLSSNLQFCFRGTGIICVSTMPLIRSTSIFLPIYLLIGVVLAIVEIFVG